jgi:ribonuclease VapC
LDSFAILGWYRREESELQVQRLLENQEHERWMTVVNLGEVYYRTAKEADLLIALEALEMVERLPIQFVEANRTLTLAAADIKAQYALSYADCFAAALALQLDAAVVTGDPEFEQLERAGIISIEWLPPRGKRRSR